MKTKKSLLVVTAIALAFALAFTACPIGPGPTPPGPGPTPTHTHQWGDWLVTTAATCSATGVETRTCALDSSHKETQIIPIDPDAHNWVPKGTPSLAPTCETAGSGAKVCTLNAAHEDNDPNSVIPALGHDYQNWTQTTAPTCTTAGVDTGTCTRDSSHTTTRAGAAINPNAHEWGNWTVTTPATTTMDGEETRTCTRDATHKETRLIAKLPGPTVSLVEMVHVTGGTFTMGSPNTEQDRGSGETEHQVTLSAFYIGKYEITQKQYETVMGTNSSNFKTNAASGETQNKRPVEMVSWYDALVFCNKLSIMEELTPAYSINGKTNPDEWGAVPTSSDATWNAVVVVNGSTGYRLPTEAQWEYACRAGTTTAYNTGDTISDNTGWYSANSDNKTHEVGKKQPNAWGLYDMHGNVWEWCWDRYGTYPTEAQTDPVGASSGSIRVLRGGSWYNTAQYARSAYRSYNIPYDRYYNLGFRLLRP